jgi:hypothetical protein
MINRYRPHVLVLPEDDANRDIANGFQLGVDFSRYRQMQVLRVAGGWRNVVELFKSEHVNEMNMNECRFFVMLIDLDRQQDRLEVIRKEIPANLADRVFVLGSRPEPESLRRANLGTYENIGLALAKDCRDETRNTWGHPLLQHNGNELDRLSTTVRSILF